MNICVSRGQGLTCMGQHWVLAVWDLQIWGLQSGDHFQLPQSYISGLSSFHADSGAAPRPEHEQDLNLVGFSYSAAFPLASPTAPSCLLWHPGLIKQWHHSMVFSALLQGLEEDISLQLAALLEAPALTTLKKGHKFIWHKIVTAIQNLPEGRKPTQFLLL